MSNELNYPFLVFALSFVAMSLGAWAGFALLRKRRGLEEEAREHFGVVLGATLTLLALLVGFSFSMAIQRYDQRKNYEEGEANAIGTAMVRAGLLPPADAAKVRALLSPTWTCASRSIRHAMSRRFATSTPARRNCRASSGPRSRGRHSRSRTRSSRWPSQA